MKTGTLDKYKCCDEDDVVTEWEDAEDQVLSVETKELEKWYGSGTITQYEVARDIKVRECKCEE